jgi:Zn-finger nucleic acid-binding protein
MECPKCLSKMKVIDFQGIEIDRCTDCFGMFFDHREEEDLKTLQGQNQSISAMISLVPGLTKSSMSRVRSARSK